jgi:hypothetical protein
MNFTRIKLNMMRAEDQHYVFLRIPYSSHWMRVPSCVIRVGCPFCEVAIGFPCVGSSGNALAHVHYRRKDADKLFLKEPTK